MCVTHSAGENLKLSTEHLFEALTEHAVVNCTCSPQLTLLIMRFSDCEGFRSSLSESEASITAQESRRDTFAFDKVLYRDSSIEITPSALLFDKSSLFGGKIIDIQDVCAVWRPVYGDAFASSNPNWWQRAALGRRRPHNLVIDVQDSRFVSLSLSVKQPDAVEKAIAIAKGLVYRL